MQDEAIGTRVAKEVLAGCAADCAQAQLLRNALARVSVKDAVGEVALATGRARRDVYQRALELAKDGSNAEG